MTKQDISVLGKEDAFDLIGKEWMLVTAGTEDKFNTMTANFIDRTIIDKQYGAHGGLHTVYVVEIEGVYTK